MSLLSSLFLHSSKPVTATGFSWAGQEVISGVVVDGRTEETRETQRRIYVSGENGHRVEVDCFW